MFLSKRSGIYYLWYQDEQGWRKKVSTGSRSKSDALQFVASFSTNRLPKKAIAPTFSEFKSKVLDYVQINYARGTFLIYQGNIERLHRLVGEVGIDQVTPYHFDLYKSKRLQEVSPDSVNIGLRTIKAVMGFAVRWRMLESNPFSHLSMVRAPERSPRFLSKDEF